jgi:hypothetical protein
MNWRSLAGAVVMGAGGLLIVAATLVGGVVLANYVDWGDPVEPLATVATILSVPLAGGVLILVLGRWLFGAWRTAAPLRIWGMRVLGAIGACLVPVLATMLALTLSSGFGDHNREMVIAMAIGVLAGLVLASLAIRREQSARWRNLAPQDGVADQVR